MKRLLVALLALTLVGFTCPIFAQDQPAGQTGAKKGAAKKTPEERFKEMDKNGDGKVTKDEWKGNPAQFDRLDKDHKGYITLEDMKAGRKAPNAGKKGGKKAPPQQ